METVDDVRAALAAARLPGRRGPRDRDLPRRCGCSARCCSRAKRAWARPRWPRCWRAGPAASWCGSSATRASTPSQAVYEWDYSRQLLHLRAVEAGGGEVVEDELYSERFLVRRPLLRAIAYEADALGRVAPPVLLVDEVDRADDEFEAFLLEILSDYTVTVPELGTFHAAVPPLVVVTSNRTRDVHDALKRRCLYHWIAHPDFERELAILRVRAPEVPEQLARRGGGRGRRRCASSSSTSRRVSRRPSTGPTRSPRSARTTIDEHAVDVTLGTILKYREDQERTRAHGLDQLVHTALGAAVPDLVVDAVTRRTRARPARGRVRPRSCAAPGSTCPSAAPSLFARGARRGRRVDDATSVYWAGRATLVRRPEDIDALRPRFAAWWDRVFHAVGTATVAGARDRRSRSTPTATTTPEPTTTATRDEHAHPRGALQPGRGAAPTATSRTYTPGRVRRGAAADGRPAPAPARCAAHGACAPSRRRRGRPTCAAPCAARCAPAASRSHRAFVEPAERPRRDRAAVRRQRLDGGLRTRARAVPARGGRRPGPGRGVRARHPAHPHHPRALDAAIPTPRSPRRPGGSPTGRAAPGSARGCASSTTSGACGAWPAARSS